MGAWDNPNYCWVVICKNEKAHRGPNVMFGHKIPLGETDAFETPPVGEPFVVRCNDCGQEYSYEPQDVLRFELELPASFTPHPRFGFRQSEQRRLTALCCNNLTKKSHASCFGAFRQRTAAYGPMPGAVQARRPIPLLSQDPSRRQSAWAIRGCGPLQASPIAPLGMGTAILLSEVSISNRSIGRTPDSAPVRGRQNG